MINATYNAAGYRVTAPLDRESALALIEHILTTAGYRESDGDLWLGTPLSQLHTFIESLCAQPANP